ncbi:MAG: E3 ubiquitin ligase family protein [Chloroflexota bacterium]
MTLVLIIVGLILIAMAIGLFYAALSTQRKTAAMSALATSSAGSVISLYSGEPAEVRGTLRCESPLTSEFAGEPCAYFSTQLTREYEEQERDSDGRTRWNRKSESIASSTQRVGFTVEDETGAVRVDPEGADIDALQVVNRFEQDHAGGITIGGVSIDLGLGTVSGRRILGYRSTEHVLRLDSPVYVIGVVNEEKDIASAPAGMKDRPFIISYRSEEALKSAWQDSARWLRRGSMACCAIGVLLLLSAAIWR